MSADSSPRYALICIRTVCLGMAVVLGAAQTWSVRHQMYSDGMSYLQIAYAYLNANWKDAINPYWSPMYSWVLALAIVVLRPSPYWQVAVLHLVNLFCFLLSFAGVELLLRNARRWKERESVPSIPDWTLYLIGYGLLIFEGLSQVHIGNTSPDMLALLLTLVLTSIVWRAYLEGPTFQNAILIGLLSAALFLSRTAFAPCVAIVLLTLALACRKAQISLRPVYLCTAIVLVGTAPFVFAISSKQGNFTFGESGRLNYAWEVNGAPKFRHWQGKPRELGKPLHATMEVSASPKAFIFPEPVGGTYPPWFNPAYWYAGIRPYLQWSSQAGVLAVNLSVLLLIFVRSPVFVPCLVSIPFLGPRVWIRRFVTLWPLAALSVATVSLYALVYVERRYLAGNVLALWLMLCLSLPVVSDRMRRVMAALLSVFTIVFVLYFAIARQRGDIMIAWNDLRARHENVPNLQYLLAARVRDLGIRNLKRVAYIGTSDNADWTRLAGITIVGEVPVQHGRNRKLFNNVMIDDYSEVDKFWRAPRSTQERILKAFRQAGAQLVISDGYNPHNLASLWSLLLPSDGSSSAAEEATPAPERSRYLVLAPE